LNKVKFERYVDWGINYMWNKAKKISLLSYWTSRYFVTLLIGLTIIGVLSVLWIRHTTIENRLDVMEYIAEDTVNQITRQSTNRPQDDFFTNDAPIDRTLRATTYILNANREIVSRNQPPMANTVDLTTLQENQSRETFEADQTYYAVQKTIMYEEKIVGYVVVFDSAKNVTKVEQQYGQLIVLIISLAILGWIVIYSLSKRVSTPIKNVSQAALQLQQGNYQIELPESPHISEVDELTTSFKEMAVKLEQLEQMRTELLAGVTHELKTPVASISGLLQAVKDGVVEKEEANTFIEMAITEATKMKTLVGDLLAFNAYAVDAVPIQLTTMSVNQVLGMITQQFQATTANDAIQLHTLPLEKDEQIQIDFVRIQQVFTNLLQNAQQAMLEGGTIVIEASNTQQHITILVKDQGDGIPFEEQPFIFERFYRGEHKKFATRGLGLGLPLSQMIMHSMNGDLQLLESTNQGSVFQVSFPLYQGE
jgi:signal transduction histidine kinase